MIDLKALSIRKIHNAIKSGGISVKEVVEDCIKEINSKNKDLNVYLEVFSDVLAQAREAQKKFDEGEATLLTGIPLAIKDNILIEGRTATAGSKILSGFISPYDSTVIAKLKKERAVFLGRANMDEFAMGSSTENSAFGPTKNPHDQKRVAGGSSGGSAAAVSGGLAFAALGSDTGGSVRQPASFCGVVGLKPTYGAVSRYGLIALGSSLDQIGPMGRCVEDVEILFNAVRGRDALDSTSVETRTEHVSPKTVGIPRKLLSVGGIHPDVEKNFSESLSKLSSMGFKIKDVELPSINYSLPAYYIIMPAEASSNLARYDGVKYGFHVNGNDLLEDYVLSRGGGFGQEPRRRIMLGTYVLSAGYYDAYYSRAVQVRSLIANEFAKAFKEVDVIATPTTPTPAFKIGEKANDPLSMYLADIFTVPANIANLPALTVPSGFSKSSDNSSELPLGLQFIGRPFDERSLFEVGKKFLGE
jgi:aspartyl-tRNA(Asn)/glutamyl-tRNA(Gln) amidotransferase subunit A